MSKPRKYNTKANERKIMIATTGMKIGLEVTRGKTKKISTLEGDDTTVIIESFDSITAGDGVKKDDIGGKAEFANQTTCNVFALLKAAGIPNAFRGKVDSTRFLADHCKMIPLEVVVRRVALGSFLHRNPGVKKGEVMSDLVVEFYLKTNNRGFNGIKIPECDDPYLLFDEGRQVFLLFNPTKEICQENIIETISSGCVMPDFFDVKPEMIKTAVRTFEVLEQAWKKLGYTLADFKIEFGFDFFGDLMVADVIDNDSWRVIDSQGAHLDKQVYREGGDLKTVKGMYEKVAQLTEEFAQQTMEFARS